MKKKLRSLATIFLLSCISVTSGCLGDQYGKSGRASNSIGTMGTSEIQRLGSPQKNVTLGKRSLSGEFAIVVPYAEKIYLGSQYKDVTPSDSFSDGKNDFIVLRCYENTSSFKNLLLIIPAVPSLTNILPLDGSSSSPFALDKSSKRLRLVQETSDPAIKNTWEILSTSEIRGPYPLQGK